MNDRIFCTIRLKERTMLSLFLTLSFCFCILPLPSSASEHEEAPYSETLWSEVTDGFYYNFILLSYGLYQDTAESSQNPGNDFLHIPTYRSLLEMRPDLYLNFRTIDLSVKPRVTCEWSWSEDTQGEEERRESEWYINEWLARAGVTDSVFVSYGRENLQWGPSQLVSLSNPFFDDNGRGFPKREIAGMDFGRFVWVPSQEWSLSLIANIDEGALDIAESQFDPTYAMKLDYSGYEGSAAIVLSHQNGRGNRLGAFGVRAVRDALLLYIEGEYAETTDALYPVQETTHPFSSRMQAKKEEDSTASLLLGVAYTFTNGAALTAEYLYNGEGYTSDQAQRYYHLRERASQSFSGPYIPLAFTTLKQTVDPGLNFFRKNYLMLHYSHKDIFQDFGILLRYTHNIDDGSSKIYGNCEYDFADNMQLFVSGTINTGGASSEFGRILDSKLVIGLEYFL